MRVQTNRLIIGFHGCDETVADAVINGQKKLSPSTNKYDWLGSGIYFWEGEELYPNAGFRKKNHIQISVRSEKKIVAYFMPVD